MSRPTTPRRTPASVNVYDNAPIERKSSGIHITIGGVETKVYYSQAVHASFMWGVYVRIIEMDQSARTFSAQEPSRRPAAPRE